MKLFLIATLSSIFLLEIDVPELRRAYPNAIESTEITEKLFQVLSPVSETDTSILMAYKGAVLTLKAKHAKGIRDKKKFFKEGVRFMESAIEKEPSNIEIRLLRLSVQENAPKITGYKNNLGDDKVFIHTHYAKTKNTAVKNLIKGYVMVSSQFTDAEKQLY